MPLFAIKSGEEAMSRRRYFSSHAVLPALLILLLALGGCGYSVATSSAVGVVAQATTVAQAGTFLYGLSMISISEGWAVGGTVDSQGKPAKATLLHYSRGKWTNVAAPVTTPLFAVSMDASSDGWAVGYGGTM